MENRTCEFCAEFKTPSLSRFGKLYETMFQHRFIRWSGEVALFPTLGQIFKGSVLIAPRAHVETMARLDSSTRSDVLKLINFARATSPLTVVFEHGSTCQSAGGCGIYHAHIHVVPVPGPLEWRTALPSNSTVFRTFADAFDALKCAENYLLTSDTTGGIAAFEINACDVAAFPSQYFRRLLTSHYSVNRAWDWRSYNYVETDMIETINAFGTNATISA
jgi:diadenosine tetraphosphate (Ap4A) HIT family hydrolase